MVRSILVVRRRDRAQRRVCDSRRRESFLRAVVAHSRGDTGSLHKGIMGRTRGMGRKGRLLLMSFMIIMTTATVGTGSPSRVRPSFPISTRSSSRGARSTSTCSPAALRNSPSVAPAGTPRSGGQNPSPTCATPRAPYSKWPPMYRHYLLGFSSRVRAARTRIRDNNAPHQAQVVCPRDLRHTVQACRFRPSPGRARITFLRTRRLYAPDTCPAPWSTWPTAHPRCDTTAAVPPHQPPL